MARITVEDCIPLVPNRFELVLLAAERACQIGLGVGRPQTKFARDAKTVTALREIADGLIPPDELKEARIRGFMKSAATEDEIAPDYVPEILDSEDALLSVHAAHARREKLRRRSHAEIELSD